MDITNLFLQQVIASKNGGPDTGWDGSSKNSHHSGHHILRPLRKRLVFVDNASEIAKTIKELQDFLQEHKTAYLDTTSRFISSANTMTEDQKDEIDRETVNTLEQCKIKITSLQHTIVEFKKRGALAGDLVSHLIGIVDILQQSLADTANSFKKLKRERLKKKQQEAEGYFKLDALKSKAPLSPFTKRAIDMIRSPTLKLPDSFSTSSYSKASPPGSPRDAVVSSLERDRERERERERSGSLSSSGGISSTIVSGGGRRSRSNSLSSSVSHGDARGRSSSANSSSIPPLRIGNIDGDDSDSRGHMHPNNNFNSHKGPLPSKKSSWLRNESGASPRRSKLDPSTAAADDRNPFDTDDDEIQLPESEKKLFDEENESLQRELSNMTDQIKSIDGQLASVSRLFDELVEHIVDQKETLESINDLTVEATNHVHKGNEQLVIATKRTVDFRLMVLLFLITCSISLLFLHWYVE